MLVDAVASKTGLTQHQTKEIIESVFDSIVELLIEKKHIELKNFGTIEIRKRKGRRAYDPYSRKIVEVPPRWYVFFRAGKAAEERIIGILGEP